MQIAGESQQAPHRHSLARIREKKCARTGFLLQQERSKEIQNRRAKDEQGGEILSDPFTHCSTEYRFTIDVNS